MAIEVVREPRGRDLRREVDCRHCGAGLRFDPKTDAKLVPDQRDGSAYVLVCPRCQNEVWVAV